MKFQQFLTYVKKALKINVKILILIRRQYNVKKSTVPAGVGTRSAIKSGRLKSSLHLIVNILIY